MATKQLSFADKVAYVEKELGVKYDADDKYYGTDYVCANERIYHIIENKELDGEDICEGRLNQNGEIEFVLQFYNGGTCFGEMIEEAVEKAQNK